MILFVFRPKQICCVSINEPDKVCAFYLEKYMTTGNIFNAECYLEQTEQYREVSAHCERCIRMHHALLTFLLDHFQERTNSSQVSFMTQKQSLYFALDTPQCGTE